MTLTATAALSKDKRHARATISGTMQHRHFAVIAGIIAEIADPEDRLRTAQRFASVLETTNPRFDRRRFMTACEP